MTATGTEGGVRGATLPATHEGDWRSDVQVLRMTFPQTVELFIRARPRAQAIGFLEQARSAYRSLFAALQAHGARPRDLVTEKVLLSHIGTEMPLVQAVRHDFHRAGGGAVTPATTWVQQPPVRPGQSCEIQGYAVIATSSVRRRVRPVADPPPGSSGQVVEAGGLRLLYLANVAGVVPRGRDRRAEAVSMFERAEACLRSEGLSFRDVVRTWIYVREMGEVYDDLNRARTAFFQSRRVSPLPASTGIQGVPFPPERTYSLDIRAVSAGAPVVPIHSPTMNEAPRYGSAFSRGVRVSLDDRVVLYVSGTASIDAEGRVVHVGDFEGQADRMLANIERLLAGQGASPRDVVCATTYLKRPSYLDGFLRACRRRGFPEAVPNTVCRAEVCRPEWLCEMEVTAVLG